MKEDQLSTFFKRHKVKERKLEVIEKEIADRLKAVPFPGWKDILPFSICRWTYFIIKLVPTVFGYFKDQLLYHFKEYLDLRRELNGTFI